MEDDDNLKGRQRTTLRGTARALCQGRKQSFQGGDKLLRTGLSKRNKPAMRYRCCARPWVQPQRPHTNMTQPMVNAPLLPRARAMTASAL